MYIRKKMIRYDEEIKATIGLYIKTGVRNEIPADIIAPDAIVMGAKMHVRWGEICEGKKERAKIDYRLFPIDPDHKIFDYEHRAFRWLSKREEEIKKDLDDWDSKLLKRKRRILDMRIPLNEYKYL